MVYLVGSSGGGFTSAPNLAQGKPEGGTEDAAEAIGARSGGRAGWW